MYPAGSLGGRGRVGDTVVGCVTAAQLVEFHTGYELRSTDRHDVKVLCDRFGIPIPDEYRRREES
jgi:lincosamide nucleotidyltransferase A/C/D/E